MRKIGLALGAAALLAVGPMVYGEAPSVDSEFSLESFPALSEGLEAGLDLYSLGNARGILPEVSMPKGASLSARSLPVLDLPGAAGCLTMEGKKYTGSALAVGIELSGEEAEETFGGMFLSGGYSREAGERMLRFNTSLLRTEGLLNEFFLTVAKGTRAATGEPLPYDFLTLDMVHVEQLHRVVTVPNTYSFAMRPYLAVDGFAMPLYLRGFASKTETGYRFLLFVTLDSFREQLDQVTYQMIHRK